MLVKLQCRELRGVPAVPEQEIGRWLSIQGCTETFKCTHLGTNLSSASICFEMERWVNVMNVGE
jgi:hypothetical protein